MRELPEGTARKDCFTDAMRELYPTSYWRWSPQADAWRLVVELYYVPSILVHPEDLKLATAPGTYDAFKEICTLREYQFLGGAL